MHELSLVMSIVKTCEEIAIQEDAKEIKEVQLEIGTMAGVEPKAFDMAWKEGTKNTHLHNAQLLIDKVEAQAQCLECKTLFPLENLFDACPNCNSHFIDIITGKQFRIKSILV